MSYDHQERRVLVRAMTDAGPHAATLCAGWQTRHLAAHLVLRERRPWVIGAEVVPGLTPWAERVFDDLANVGSGDDAAERWSALVERVGSLPPRWSPFSWAGNAINSIEYFVHTEDVRRASGNDTPRPMTAQGRATLWRSLRRMAPLAVRRAGVGVTLTVPHGPSVQVARPRTDAGTVVVTGDVGELVLFALGRGRHAHVRASGDPDDRARLAEICPGPGSDRQS